MAERVDYYEILGVARTASHEEIAGAYRRLAIKYHPDKNPGDEEAVVKFKQAAEAFEVLGDADKRGRYDRYGHAGVEAGRGGGGGFADVEDIFSAFGDIFGDVFGGGRRGGRRVSRGADVRCDVTISLMEAARGVTKTVEFHRHEACVDCGGSGARPGSEKTVCQYCGGAGQVIQSSGIFRIQTTCPSCHGEGTVIKDPCPLCRGTGFMPKKVRTEVQIPPGVDTGMRVRIAGQGEPSPNGGPPGDCYCFITVEEHPLFERDGQNLSCRVPITLSQAALGATIEVPTLDGRDELKIAPGTQPGEVFRLRGRGMKDPRRMGTGDLLVQVNVEVPHKINERQEELLREMADLEQVHVSPRRKSFFETLKDYFVPEHDEETETAEQK
jgi:molecular chaperone DnaJ